MFYSSFLKKNLAKIETVYKLVSKKIVLCNHGFKVLFENKDALWLYWWGAGEATLV